MIAKVKKNGPDKTDQAVLSARGSWRARRREKEARQALIVRPQDPKWRAPSKAKLVEICRTEIPAYDPWKDCGDARFDHESAVKALRFFHERLRHVEGAVGGQPFKLEKWQIAIVANIFGWLVKDASGRWVRRYREAFIYVPRKNGKTPLVAGMCLFVLCESGERGMQIVSAAAEREQAALLFRHARGMVEQSEYLDEKCDIFKAAGMRSIALKDDPASAYKVISSDAYSKHGQTLSLGIVDELHALPNRELLDVLNTSTASLNRPAPLMVYITTADFQRESICNEKLDYAKKVRDGILSDPSFLPVVYEAGRDEDWTDPEVWARVNPNLGVSVSGEYLERESKRAREVPAYENTFKRLHLNVQTEQDVRLIPMQLWSDLSRHDMVPPRLPPFGAIDLATTTDIAALVLCWRLERGVFIRPYFWVPEANAEQREKKDRVPYQTWCRQGFMKATPGNVIDYAYIRKECNALYKSLGMKQVAIDPWNATQLGVELGQDGFDVQMFRQGFASMAGPTKELLRLIEDGSFYHDGNPVLTWMAGNCAAEIDPAGNMKLSKKKSPNKIDGMVAAVMALGLLMQHAEKTSAYNQKPRFLTV